MKKIFFALALCLFAQITLAQKTYIGYIFPSGGPRGSEFIIEIGGQSILGSQTVLVSGEGIKAEIIPEDPKEIAKKKQAQKKKKKNISDEDNLQLADAIKVKITIDKTASLGMRDVKIQAPNGTMSNRLFFEIGQYPNFVETESNSSIEKANLVDALPTVLNGQVERGGRDFFCFEAKKGQRIVAKTLARRFVPYLADAVPGWFQAVTTIYDSDFKEVAYSDDYNLVADPTIIFTPKKTGKYYLEIKDAIFRGRADFVYRIDLGEIPFVTSIFPLGWSEKSTQEFEIKGENLAKEKIKIKTPKAQDRYSSFVVNKNKHESNAFTLQISDKKEELIAKDLGDEISSATPLVEDKIVNARIEHEYDKDWYYFDVDKKNSTWSFEITARRLGSSLDAKITIMDAQGVVVKQEDDTNNPSEGMITHHADALLVHKFTKIGRYYIRVTDTQNKFGDNYAYRLHAYQSTPGFRLRIEPSAISIPQGGSAHFTVFPERDNGFRQSIEIKSDNLPEGFSLSNAVINQGAKSYKMSITAPENAPVGKVDFSLYGESKSRKGEVTKSVAQPVEAMLQAFYITHLIPTDEFRVDIAQAEPFSLSVDDCNELPLQLDATNKVKLKVRVKRQEGYTEPILIMYRSGMSKAIFADLVTATAEDEFVTLEIECVKWYKPKSALNCSLLGTVKATTQAKVAGQKRNSISAAVMVVSPYFHCLTPITEDPNRVVKKKETEKNDTNK
ncbi:MAG: hypothetical protein R3Y38_07415 [Rikenellaceae bacterium]